MRNTTKDDPSDLYLCAIAYTCTRTRTDTHMHMHTGYLSPLIIHFFILRNLSQLVLCEEEVSTFTHKYVSKGEC